MTKPNSSDWAAYYEKLKGAPPRPTLAHALEVMKSEGVDFASSLAIDLGCGAGQDTVALLNAGWNVLAVDRELQALQYLESALPASSRERFDFLCVSFEEVELPKSNFINASYSLPFCDTKSFPRLWSQILGSVESGGRFAGQFFGPMDDWIKNGSLTGHDEATIRNHLLSDFEFEFWKEMNEPGATATGGDKHWHVFSVVARRKT